MSIPLQILDEQRIELPEAARLLGSEKRPASLAKISRAISRGVKAETGERIKLEAVRTGACWLTSVEAVRRFVERLTCAATRKTGPAETTISTPSARRRREIERAEREADTLRI
jgi:hypothetical protein